MTCGCDSKRSSRAAPDRATAEEQLAELRARTESLGLDFEKFWTTYDNWKTGILNYFDGRPHQRGGRRALG